ncbi:MULTISPECIES: hypothetical protein [unclassified Frankia]|uniref:hypothetical protein n=1 Tax=unclassified Frankia TaxID=2632575 RepID=UPI002AD49349|nr:MULTISPECIES: hypothetical protein [unclassified Frankia]
MIAIQHVTRQAAARLLMIAVLALGVAGATLSVTHPNWFSGSTADAGVMQIGPVKPGTPTGPIIVSTK